MSGKFYEFIKMEKQHKQNKQSQQPQSQKDSVSSIPYRNRNPSTEQIMQEGNRDWIQRCMEEGYSNQNKYLLPNLILSEPQEQSTPIELVNQPQGYKVKHKCDCEQGQQQCKGLHCTCYLTLDQICMEGQCCRKCVQNKNYYFQNTKGWSLKQTQKEDEMNKIRNIIRNNPCKNMYYFKRKYPKQAWLKHLNFCTCQKSHCLKNYCQCFAKGNKCGQFCSCIGCNNCQEKAEVLQREQKELWQKYSTYKQKQEEVIKPIEDIEQYLQVCIEQDIEFNEEMSFEPPNFDDFQEEK